MIDPVTIGIAFSKVHTASVKLKSDNLGKSDSELSAVALEIAMNSKRLRDAEKELKELLIYSGNADVWEDMLRERTRLIKERNAARLEMVKQQAKRREKMAEDLLAGAVFLMLVFFLYIGFKIAWQILTKS